eukprot:Sspe_Gene.38508::Locus_18552_Transcript_1_1_Confidence_1.000_Length_1129::g.38508::m.38508
MTTYWQSSAKWRCPYCKIYINDHPAARRQHETGRKHLEKMKDAMERQSKKNDKSKEDEINLEKELARINRIASREYLEHDVMGKEKDTEALFHAKSYEEKEGERLRARKFEDFLENQGDPTWQPEEGWTGMPQQKENPSPMAALLITPYGQKPPATPKVTKPTQAPSGLNRKERRALAQTQGVGGGGAGGGGGGAMSVESFIKKQKDQPSFTPSAAPSQGTNLPSPPPLPLPTSDKTPEEVQEDQRKKAEKRELFSGPQISFGGAGFMSSWKTTKVSVVEKVEEEEEAGEEAHPSGVEDPEEYSKNRTVVIKGPMEDDEDAEAVENLDFSFEVRTKEKERQRNEAKKRPIS